MAGGNLTRVVEFILLGLTENPSLQIPLFVLFLLVYIITVLSNSCIVTLICTSSRLHTPMYFLLSNLSFVDLCYSSTITPIMLANFLSERKAISLVGCVAQMFSFVFLGGADILLLGIMAYDRYVAICNPLLYRVTMTKHACIFLVAGAYFGALLNALIHTSLTLTLSFCRSNKITHFYCDVPPLLKLSCTNIRTNEAVLIFVGGGVMAASLFVVIISYTFIISAVLRTRSSEGRHRLFSTCSAHFLCVTLFFSTSLFMYVRPTSSYVMDQDRVASVFYTVVIPMLNPLIYSLRNQQVKESVRDVVHRVHLFRKRA
ncbi:olfactory receptor 8U9-like [Ambystoma mexicanum]|uniref:olfactory receptor 8U9-like n=1 Tax=Ambystoma mexicanum TaxID=8296 RepID=UPI0037E7A36D